jgi:hypothetical protein
MSVITFLDECWTDMINIFFKLSNKVMVSHDFEVIFMVFFRPFCCFFFGILQVFSKGFSGRSVPRGMGPPQGKGGGGPGDFMSDAVVIHCVLWRW